MNRAFSDETSAAEFTEAWMAAAQDATGDVWRINDGPDGVTLVQEFRSAKSSRDLDVNVIHGAIYCSVSSRRSLADFLFFCVRDGLWPLRYMEGCGSPEEAMLKFAARGVVP